MEENEYLKLKRPLLVFDGGGLVSSLAEQTRAFGPSSQHSSASATPAMKARSWTRPVPEERSLKSDRCSALANDIDGDSVDIPTFELLVDQVFQLVSNQQEQSHQVRRKRLEFYESFHRLDSVRDRP